MTLDGKIASRTGDSKWITSDASRSRVHELRGRMDAIIIGIGTALSDNPLLTARPPGPRTPCRIVLDVQGRLPVASQLVSTARETPTLIATGAEGERIELLREAGCEILALPSAEGNIDVKALLAELGRRRWTNVLVEGGAAVLGSFLDARAIDEVHVFIAPRLLGGSAAKTAIGGHGIGKVAEALALAQWGVETIGDDLLVHGWCDSAES
jgi:diaminohydroxyphosphoribosylaminopyrimidine deaminase/5-amino-6-(5-phosphoribosylamino)uracil reductase